MVKKVVFVFGTRPEFIKIAPVVRELRKTEWAQPIVIATGQHRDLTAGIAETFDVFPDFILDTGEPAQTLSDILSNALPPVDALLKVTRPTGIVVQGDAHSAFVGALAAYYNKLPLAHIEAGLRTNDKFAPYPEEMNRRLISILTDIHFAPTNDAAANLRGLGGRIAVTGNTEIDAYAHIAEHLSEMRTARPYPTDKRLIVATVHRRESFGEAMEEVFDALALIAKRKDVNVVIPLHLNPHVQEAAEAIGLKDSRVHILPPLPYSEFVRMMTDAYFVITDSGGVQEVAAAMNIPALVVREKTERMEGIKAGCARLVGTDARTIITAATELLDDDAAWRMMSRSPCPYGDGNARKCIVKILEEEWGHET